MMRDKPFRHWKRRWSMAASGTLAAVSAVGLIIVSTLAPDRVERFVGDTKVMVEKLALAGTRPSIHLEGAGGTRELDAAEHGRFVEMVSYRYGQIPPVFAAHNNRGGDVILGWNVGDEVDVVDSEGNSVTYRVIDDRTTSKTSKVDKLEGLRGEIILQSCYYGEDRMRFLGLSPAG